MKKHRGSEALYAAGTIFQYRMKLIGKDTATRVILLGSILVFAWMIFSLSVSANEQSALPVGIIDRDLSESSENLIARLDRVSTLKVIRGSEKELNKKLLDEMIMSYFIIEDGYEEKIQSGDVTGIIDAYFKSDNKAASIITDVIAGEIMYPICYYKAWNLYRKLDFEGTKHTQTEYSDYIGSLQKNSPDFDFAFDMNYIGPDQSVVSKDALDNSILYQQLVFGILGILMAFIAMFVLSGTVQEKEIGVAKRFKLTGFYPLRRDMGNFLALILLEAFVSAIFSVMIFTKYRSVDFKLIASAYLLLMQNAIVLGGIFLLLAKLIKSMVVYQLVTSLLILATGGIGFFHLLTGFYSNPVATLVKFIPNSWFIQGFTDIIIYGNTGSYLKEGHRVLFLMAGSVIILLIAVDLLSRLTVGRSRINRQNRMVN